MTQRIFDIENEKDYADLWDILPDEVNKIEKYGVIDQFSGFCAPSIPAGMCRSLIKINWHDKTEITRPVDYESMIGCVCKFSTCPIRIGGCFIGVLDNIDKDSPCKFHVKGGGWFEYCEPVKKSELKFWGE